MAALEANPGIGAIPMLVRDEGVASGSLGEAGSDAMTSSPVVTDPTVLSPTQEAERTTFENFVDHVEKRTGFELEYKESSLESAPGVAILGSGPDGPGSSFQDVGTNTSASLVSPDSALGEVMKNYHRAANHAVEMHLIANAGSSMTTAMNKLTSQH